MKQANKPWFLEMLVISQQTISKYKLLNTTYIEQYWVTLNYYA